MEVDTVRDLFRQIGDRTFPKWWELVEMGWSVPELRFPGA